MSIAEENAETLVRVERNIAVTEDMLRHAHIVTPDRAEQIGALITAAIVLIEREVGREAASSLLIALVNPTLADWQAAARAAAHWPPPLGPSRGQSKYG